MSVIVTYLTLFYSLASFQFIGDKFGLTVYLKPLFDFLAPVLYLISDMIRLNSQQIAYILGAIVLLFVVLAIAKSRPKSNEHKMPKPQYMPEPKQRGPSLLSKLVSGLGQGTKGLASKAADKWKQERERSRREAARDKEYKKQSLVAEKEQKKNMELARREQQRSMEIANKEKAEELRREQKLLAIKERLEIERQEKIKKQIAENKRKAEEADRKAMVAAQKEEVARYRCRFCGGKKENPNDQMCRACFKKGLEEQLRKQPKMLPPHRG